MLAQRRRLLERPVMILGYNRQRIRANWKLYAENTATITMPACCTNFS